METILQELCLSNREQIAKDFFGLFKREQRYVQTTVWHQDEFRNDVKTVDDIARILGHKWKWTLQHRVYPFVHHLYYTAPNGFIEERPVSCYNKKLLATIGSYKNVNKARSDLVKLDCLKCVNEHYWFGKKECLWYGGQSGGIMSIKSKFDPKAKIYIINKQTVNLIFGICVKMFGRLKADFMDVEETDMNALNESDYKKMKKATVDFKSKLRLDVKDYSNVNSFKACVMKTLNAKYPWLKHYMDLRKQLNAKLDPRAQGVYQPNFTFTGTTLTKIGMRDANWLCNKKSNVSRELVKQDGLYVYVKKEAEHKGVWFKDFANQILGNGYVQYDIKSSIPRVMRLLKTGIWVDESIDIYQQIYGKPFESSIQRDCYKFFVLCAIFNSEAELVRNLSHRFTADEWAKDGDDIAEFIITEKRKVDSYLGVVNDTTVFCHESNIYMEVEKVLQKMGVGYIKKYDCFYMDRQVSNMGDIVKVAAMSYYRNWILLNGEGGGGKNEGRYDNKPIRFDTPLPVEMDVQGNTVESNNGIEKGVAYRRVTTLQHLLI